MEGLVSISTQIVVTGELDENGDHPLRLLTRHVGEKDLQRYIIHFDKWKEPGDRENLSALLNVCIAANNQTFQRVRRELTMTQEQILREVFSDWIVEGRAEGKAEGRAEKQIEIVQNMLREHLPVNIITKCSDFSAERIRELAKGIGVAVVQ